MRHSAFVLISAFAFIACGNTAAPVDMDGDGTISPTELAAVSEEQKPTKKFVEGKDYVVLERLRVIDPNGFAQPMERTRSWYRKVGRARAVSPGKWATRA